MHFVLIFNDFSSEIRKKYESSKQKLMKNKNKTKIMKKGRRKERDNIKSSCKNISNKVIPSKKCT